MDVRLAQNEVERRCSLVRNDIETLREKGAHRQQDTFAQLYIENSEFSPCLKVS